MHWIHIKHDNCKDDKGGLTGKSRMSIGPYSKKAASAAMNEMRMAHRTHHLAHSRQVVCILKIEREPLDV